MLGDAITRNAEGGDRGELGCSVGAGRTWTDTASVTAGSTGRGMQMEVAGGSGRGSSGDGKYRSMHIRVYLNRRVGSCTAGVMMEEEHHRRGDAPREEIRQPSCRAAVPAQPGRWW